jgi:predicted transcriptional regulator
MSRRKAGPDLSALQLAVMRVLWRRGEATVAEVQEGLRPERDLAATTVATTLLRLERRGAVDHRTVGRQFVYVPRVGEGDVRRSMVCALTERLFGGDSKALVSHLLREEDIDPSDLARIKALIDERLEGKEGR